MKRSFFAVIGLVFLSSCLEELGQTDKIQSATFEPLIDFPLVNSDFTMEEFLTQGRSKAKIIDRSGLMVLIYDDSIASPPGNLFFSLSDQQSPVLSITGPEVSFPSPGASVTITKNLTFTFNTSQGEILDSIVFKAGQIRFQLNSTFAANIDLTIDLASIKIQSAALQRNFSFAGAGNQISSVNLQDASLDLTLNGTTTNTISFSVTATITDTGQPISNTDQLNCSFDMNSLLFRGMFGDLGPHPFQFNADSINVDVFNSQLTGNLELLSPLLSLRMKNSFGFPISFDIQSIEAIRGNANIVLNGQAMSTPDNPYLINAPNYSQIGQSVASVIDIHSGNSNISELISSLPQYMSYQFDLSLNPAPVTAKNFVRDDSRLNIGVHLELPFHGRVSGLSLSRQFDFSGIGIDDVGETWLKVKTTNETPLDASVQVYFVDDTGTILDSLFTDPSILKGAPVDASGFTQGSVEVTEGVFVTQDKINRIDQSKYLVLSTVMFTTNGGTVPVKFSSADAIKINIGISTKVKYVLN